MMDTGHALAGREIERAYPDAYSGGTFELLLVVGGTEISLARCMLRRDRWTGRPTWEECQECQEWLAGATIASANLDDTGGALMITLESGIKVMGQLRWGTDR